MHGTSVGKTYTEVLQVVDGHVVTEEVDKSILKHASVTVAALGVSNPIASCPAKKLQQSGA